MQSALITGLSGCELTRDEASFLAEVRPAGIILFARNCQSHGQIRKLVQDALTAIGCDSVLVLIDQEGGRVQRLRPPLGRSLPAAGAFGRLFASNCEDARVAARLIFRLLARDLRDLGINMDCAPVLDLPVPGSHEIIGDRAYGTSTDTIAKLGRAVGEGLMAGGVVPVIKHIPGHGRAKCDSHLDLPVVDDGLDDLTATDFEPFRQLADMPSAMTAHVVYTAIDKDRPVTVSRTGIEQIIRGRIGFDGLLMSDDLSMKALSGSMRSRAEAAITAGCDLALHCNGDMREMRQVAEGTPALAEDALRRFQTAFAVTGNTDDFDDREAEATLETVLAIG